MTLGRGSQRLNRMSCSAFAPHYYLRVGQHAVTYADGWFMNEAERPIELQSSSPLQGRLTYTSQSLAVGSPNQLTYFCSLLHIYTCTH